MDEPKATSEKPPIKWTKEVRNAYFKDRYYNDQAYRERELQRYRDRMKVRRQDPDFRAAEAVRLKLYKQRVKQKKLEATSQDMPQHPGK